MIRMWGGTSFLWREEGICVSLHALLSVGWNCGRERISFRVWLEWSTRPSSQVVWHVTCTRPIVVEWFALLVSWVRWKLCPLIIASVRINRCTWVKTLIALEWLTQPRWSSGFFWGWMLLILYGVIWAPLSLLLLSWSSSRWGSTQLPFSCCQAAGDPLHCGIHSTL